MENKDKDFLHLYVKSGKTKEIIKLYKLFGWELLEQSDNKNYEDIVDLSFSRPHQIANKDELQLYQVHLEENLNNSARNERLKHSKTTALALVFGPIGLALITLGLLFFLNVLPVLGLAGGIVMSIVGLTLIVIGSIFLPKLSKKEKQIFQDKQTNLNRELIKICNKVQSLVGGEDGKD
ncbi:MAG: hypothetical protein J6J24_04450 [Clostridia bacterium]|nr:hypothetical protein [Clostridia bacterium]